MKRYSIILAAVAVLALPSMAQASFPSQKNVKQLIGGGKIKDNSIQSKDIKNGTIQLSDLNSGLIKYLASQSNSPQPTINAPKGDAGATGAKGDTGSVGPAGPQGDVGPAGPKGDVGSNGMLGAYYAVANYNAGDTNAGAVATVACSNVTDVAISGGVQTLGLDGTPLDNNTPVSSSFPGRMDWSTNTPREDRLDGWIVQFGGNAGPVSDNSPLRVKVYALCLPGQTIPVVETFTQVEG
jgi:hypothetical protein